MVLSYTTSPAYHRIAGDTERYAAAAFDEGHYMQVEVAAKVATTDQPDLADAFLDYMTGPEFQAVIPTTQWMYPAVDLPDGLPEGFDGAGRAERAAALRPGGWWPEKPPRLESTSGCRR